MAQEPQFQETQFGTATKVGQTYLHPVTGQTYVWGGNQKRSWRLVSDIENRTYTGPSAPDETFENLKNGDLWWDNEHFELRVYHKVPLTKDESTGDVTYSEGVWVSSTHPMMDPDEPEKMKQFGNIICTPAKRNFTEGSEFKFEAHLPYHNVPYDQWKVTASVAPSYLGTNPDSNTAKNQVYIDFDPDTGEIVGSLVLGYYPKDDPEADDPVLERTVRVNIKVEATTDLEGEEADEFYEGFYKTSTNGGFNGVVEHLPSHPPLVVNTIPFKEQLSDTIEGHVDPDSDLLTNIDYLDTAKETIRFVPINNADDTARLNISSFTLMGRIDGALDYEEGEQYPQREQLPNLVMYASHGQAKQLVIMFKYGTNENDPIEDNYVDQSDEFGTVRETWQADYIGYGDVKGVMDNMRIAFFVDGEDDDTVDNAPNLYKNRFDDMGIVTKYTVNGASIEGQFIGLILTAENTKNLKEIADTGRKRLYFACLKPTNLGPTYSVADIHPSTKGYIDIESFTPAGS